MIVSTASLFITAESAAVLTDAIGYLLPPGERVPLTESLLYISSWLWEEREYLYLFSHAIDPKLSESNKSTDSYVSMSLYEMAFDLLPLATKNKSELSILSTA